MEITTLHEFQGAYGGAAARDEILRALKEALALVEYTAAEAELACPGWRIEILGRAHGAATGGVGQPSSPA